MFTPMDATPGAGVQVLDGRGIKTARLAETIALAFLKLAPCGYLVPVDADRLEVMTCFFELEVEAAKETGEVLVTGDGAGVSLWVPRSAGSAGVPELTDELAAAVGTYAENFLAFERELVAHSPQTGRFVHLTELAVHPDAQRSGLGTAMLDEIHGRLDKTGATAYLEAASLELTSFYERFGYRRHGTPIFLPGGINMFPMVREPLQQ